MKHILLFGAGKSATVLIDHLLATAAEENWMVSVVDANREQAESKVAHSPQGRALSFDINDDRLRQEAIAAADIVISLLPPALHIRVAQTCLQEGKNLLTASYIDPAIRELAPAIAERGLLFLYEMGLDPGIDHMSAMRIFHDVKEKGGTVTSFISHCGGLVAPESDNNPWHYKISWNPRNIILAGKAGAHYREHGKEITLPYAELFARERPVAIPGLGRLCWYPNRDSLSYTKLYDLEDTGTFIRTTLRHPAFIGGWNMLIRLGLTDETPQYDTDGKCLGRLLREHLERQGFGDWLEKLLASPDADHHREQLLYLGLQDEHTLVNKGLCSAADILQFAVERKLALDPGDKDMIVMLHETEYQLGQRRYAHKSSLVVKGEDSLRTAMARTVGLPLGIAAKLILQGRIGLRGLRLPVDAAIYDPVLQELAKFGIAFQEQENEIHETESQPQ